ncbi:energy-coupling factor transporter transmembrane component T family protein [Candidatus Stoquefichus sp. SB1]|jgi:energy-coupling factor transport system permease protein|uniref:energy-coupling factor transporter transmembrane component T family protein n=1 Tax=Candidatus Stoquefichus sp. SB1 TaxID=1658109 RepID=UPI00067EC440|nr:energy-coupling factor transporter transmembrane component T [Candidatus Stoquefichus sp. SB1]
MNNMMFGKYLPLNSVIHRLDPRLKIGSLLLLLIAVFFDAGFIGYALLGIFVMIMAILSKIKISQILKAIKPMLFMMAFLLIFNLLFIQKGNLILSLGFIKIYDEALLQTAYIFIRLILIIVMTTILTATTKPLDLTLGIEHLLSPFKKLGFPTHEVAMMISIALRFIPTLLEETQRIMKAQASRGVEFSEGSLKDKIMSIVSLIIPLFISAFQRAEDLANAMESRNYNPEAKRTRYKQLRWQFADTISFACVLLMCTTLVVMSIVL